MTTDRVTVDNLIYTQVTFNEDYLVENASKNIMQYYLGGARPSPDVETFGILLPHEILSSNFVLGIVWIKMKDAETGNVAVTE
jgi:hypothetical protein